MNTHHRQPTKPIHVGSIRDESTARTAEINDSQRGAAIVETALLLGLIALVVAAISVSLGNSIKSVFSETDQKLDFSSLESDLPAPLAYDITLS